jgi:hypothetical protein
MSIEVMKMALEALTNPSTIAVQHAIALLQEELAKPEWVGLTDEDIRTLIYHNGYMTSSLVIETEAMLKERNT